jgi:SH3-like domain-containing protein
MRPKYRREMTVIAGLLLVLFFSQGLPLQAGEVPKAGLIPCHCTAYVIDTDPKGLNVRSGPGTNYTVTATIPTNNSVEIWIIGSLGPWMSIERAYIFAEDDTSDDVDMKITGFIYGPLLAVQTRPSGLKLIPLYTEPDITSRVIAELPMDIEVVLTGCQGTWVKVKYGDIEGWLDPESHCGNPVTTCP